MAFFQGQEYVDFQLGPGKRGSVRVDEDRIRERGLAGGWSHAIRLRRASRSWARPCSRFSRNLAACKQHKLDVDKSREYFLSPVVARR